MLEIEAKYPLADPERFAWRLAEGGARPVEDRADADHYFNAPDRDFARTDEALRLRRIGPNNFVTYKGPKRDLQTKTRTEIEVPLAPGDEAADDFARLLGCLGYKAVAVVRKQRKVFAFERGGFELHASVDTVEEVGTFAELEIVAAEERYEAAKAVLLETATALGLEGSERRSYLELLLTARGRA